ncbi:MAG: hypothetical protein JRH19_18285, partial [Deltaproteobacteria bacterium]|nr:hypothetical protein [Deltaproteobacteria bacterium]
MDKLELRKRIERFASLQAAHRALARSVHPSELAVVREQSRGLLIRLQGLSSELRDDGAGAPAAEGSISLEEIDRVLADQSVRYPDEVGGLVDLLLTGDLEDDKILRTLEYLITMLSAEEQGGRRVVVGEPSAVRPRLREVGEQIREAAGDECMLAERVFEDAVVQLLQQGDLGEIRDRVRRYKEELRSKILHPQVLATVVAYNVAMFNCVAAEIDSSRAVDDLAKELFDPETEAEAAAPSSVSGAEILGSRVFEELVAALRAKVIGKPPEPGPAGRAVAPLSLAALRAEDAEIFSGEESDEAVVLMQSAITLGLVLRHLAQTEGPMARMTELARKRFADSQYSDAFRLSDVKTHSLGSHAVARTEAAPASAQKGAPGAVRSSGASASQPGAVAWIQEQITLRSTLLGLLALLLLGLLFGTPRMGGDRPATGGKELVRISPFLESGERGRGDRVARFDGRLSRSWDFLGTAERREVAMEIGRHFEGIGVQRVTLLGVRGRLMVIYADGELVTLLPRP